MVGLQCFEGLHIASRLSDAWREGMHGDQDRKTGTRLDRWRLIAAGLIRLGGSHIGRPQYRDREGRRAPLATLRLACRNLCEAIAYMLDESCLSIVRAEA